MFRPDCIVLVGQLLLVQAKPVNPLDRLSQDSFSSCLGQILRSRQASDQRLLCEILPSLSPYLLANFDRLVLLSL
jgi:hypothetical protein